jgi:hypothetical protein
MKTEINLYGEKSIYIEKMNGNININIPETILSSEEIFENLNNASVALSSYKNKFSNQIHIERNETIDLYNWIVADLKPKENSIAVLAGNAGYGKSVIIRDLFDKLQQEQIPVLGIKADRIVIQSLDELNNELELGDTVQSVFKKLSSTNEKFVLLIDQIDALSQSLSSDRSPINTYHRLIQNISHIPNIRIIISCRLYDLDYDPLLQDYKNYKTFETSLLTVADVERVLQSLNMQVHQNIFRLKEFLRIPLHLQLFCKLSNPEDFSETTTLQTLYDEIWRKFILQKPNNIQLDSTNVQQLIKEIATQMYDTQQLIVNQKLFENQYNSELTYLASEEIITIPEKNKIQFIHQSFFDYVYARTFVEQRGKISDFIQNQHQGLFIRSTVKQVFAYLRELNPQQYIQEFENVLFGNFRFHLKLLLINSLGFYTNPIDEEKWLVKQKLIQDDVWFKLFIESVNTLEWFIFLVNEVKIINYFKENVDKIFNLCRKMLYASIEETIAFMEKINNISFENRGHFIGSLLALVPADKIHISFSLYRASKSIWNDHDIYHYLRVAVKNHPDFVIEELQKKITDSMPYENEMLKYEHIPDASHSSDVYKAIFQSHIDKAALFFIELIKQIVAATKISYTDSERNEDRIFNSYAYFSFVPLKDAHYFHEEMYDMILGYLDDLFKTDFDKAKEIILPLLESDSAIIINISVYFMCKYPEQFKEYAFKILSTEYFYTSATEVLNYNIRELLGGAYPLFSLREREQINKIIMRLAPDWEKGNIFRTKGVSQYGYTRIGYTSYQLISMIPDSLRKEYLEMDKFFNEKFRQYGKLENEAPQGMVTHVGDATLNKNAYENMTDSQWKKSFMKITSTHHFDWNIPTITGHGRAFEECVFRDPNRFIVLINDIIEDKKKLTIYMVYGLQGLQKANYDPLKTKELFVKLIKKRFYDNEIEKEPLQYLVWLTEYFIDKLVVDQDIIDFLAYLVINYQDEEIHDKDPFLSGINRVRGAASFKLVQCYKFKQYKENIFSALESMAKNAAVHTRAAAMHQMVLLNHLDTERNRNLFFSLIDNYYPQLLKLQLHNFHPLIYFIHADFSKLVTFFTKTISVEESHSTISHVLFIAWLHEYKKSKEILDEILDKSSDARKTIVKAAFETIENKDFHTKCWEMLHRFLNEDDEDLGKEYEHGFLKIDDIEFSKDLESLLDKYVHSPIGKYRGYYFYALLLKLSKDIPEKCIEWALQFKEHEKPDIQKRMLRNEPLQVVIQSYNAIRKYNKNNPILEIAMDTFDKMLEAPEYRGTAKDILQKIDEK